MPQSTNDAGQRFVYLVQHGEAKPKSEDPERSLTTAGSETVARVAGWAARIGVRVDQIHHSGKTRARQTAEIFAEHLHPKEGVTPFPGLAPNDDVEPLAGALADCHCSVMLIGHLPFLGRLAALMVVGDPQVELVGFRNAGVVGLVRREDTWTLACVVPPDMTG